MRIQRLLLQAFGPFTDCELDFGRDPGQTDLHLIHGPNEAGKSAALRAMLDLRFGIPERSGDNFLHDYSNLRIVAVLQREDGAPLALARRKGRGQTLQALDPITLEPLARGIDESETLNALEQALRGGLDRMEFEARHGLNHTRLREGGRALVAGEGELGSALFEASAGLIGINRLLTGLDEDAGKLFKPNARQPAINRALSELKEQRARLRELGMRPHQWQQLEDAARLARELLQAEQARLRDLQLRRNRLTELRSVQPLLATQDRLTEELTQLSHLPQLAEDFRDQRLAAEHALEASARRFEELALEDQQIAEQLSRLQPESALLELAETIDHLAAGLDERERGRRALLERGERIDVLTRQLAAEATRLGQRDPWQLLERLPGHSDRVALREMLSDLRLAQQALATLEQRLIEIDQALAEQVPEIALPDEGDRQPLRQALEQARALGDPAQQLRHLESEMQERRQRLLRLLQRLLPPEVSLQQDAELERQIESLALARPLRQEPLQQAQQQAQLLTREAEDLSGESRRLAADLADQRTRLDSLVAEGETVTLDQLREAREQRDHVWQELRASGLPATQPAAWQGPAERLTLAMQQADHLADRLRDHAERAASIQQCRQRIQAMQTHEQELAQRRAALDAEQDRFDASWRQQLAQHRLPPLDAAALIVWQEERERVLGLAEEQRQARQHSEQLVQSVRDGVARLRQALDDLGQKTLDAGLARLLHQASELEQHYTEQAAREQERALGLARQRRERARLIEQREQTRQRIAELEARLEDWRERLWLGPDATPIQFGARLEELDQLAKGQQELQRLRQEMIEHQTLVADFDRRCGQVLGALGEPAIEGSDGAELPRRLERLMARLKRSREAQHGRELLQQRRLQLRQERQRAEQQGDAARGVLRGLIKTAGVKELADLPRIEQQLAERRSLGEQLRTTRLQLEQASSLSPEQLRAELAEQDSAQLAVELAECARQIEQQEQLEQRLRRDEEQARRALEAVDGSDAAAEANAAVEAAAASIRHAALPWLRLKLAGSLLREALDHYRERAQAPMLSRAAAHFARISGGRYIDLLTDSEGDRPVLRARRFDGMEIGVEAMSEGTADQLYLALRLAALELDGPGRATMPLVLDDVLITSDDTRVANILGALETFARQRQVLLFTHQRQLVELAGATLGSQGIGIHHLGSAD